ncbi:MAG: dephospho-CoA kinase [Aureliella sp.]
MPPVPESKRAKVIGVIGGIASGKSNLSNVLESIGGVRVDADAIAHSVLRKPLVVRRLVQLLGEGILNSRGEIDRGRLAALAFPPSGQRTRALMLLEEVTHPVIHACAVRKISQLHEDPKVRAIVIDAPLLLEAGWAPMCDHIVFIDTADAVRLERAKARGWTREHFEARESAQLPIEEKRLQATHMVSGELEVEQLRDFCQRLIEST